MKWGMIVTVFLSVLVLGAATALADHNVHSQARYHHRSAYPSCQASPYVGRYSHYPATVRRDYYYRSHNPYPHRYSRYQPVYDPYHHRRSHGHVGVHGRNFSLHFGF